MLKEANERYVPAFALARLYVGLGEIEPANLWMNPAIGNREGFAMAIRTYPQDSFRSARYYSEWLKKIGLEP